MIFPSDETAVCSISTAGAAGLAGSGRATAAVRAVAAAGFLTPTDDVKPFDAAADFPIDTTGFFAGTAASVRVRAGRSGGGDARLRSAPFASTCAFSSASGGRGEANVGCGRRVGSFDGAGTMSRRAERTELEEPVLSLDEPGRNS